MRKLLCMIFGHQWRYLGGRAWAHYDRVHAICARCGREETHVIKLARGAPADEPHGDVPALLYCPQCGSSSCMPCPFPELRCHFAGTRGRNLACWCRPGEPCHADVLLELANRPVCEEVPGCLR